MSDVGARVLFVDDEPALLAGLTRTLMIGDTRTIYRGVSSGSAALRQLEEERYDVVVTDMRMPGMKGEDLLVEVARRHPAVIRMSMSGVVEGDRSPNAHQWIDKPCPPGDLRSRIEHAIWARGLVRGRRLREAVTRISAPVPRDDLRPAVQAAWQEPDPLAHFAALSKAEIALPPRLAEFVAAGHAALVGHDASQLRGGILTSIRADQLLGAFAALEVFYSPEAAEFQPLWEHSLRTARIAVLLAQAEQVPDEPFDVFVAAVLHAIGKPVLAAENREAWPAVMRLRQRGAQAPSVIDPKTEVTGRSHADVGAAMLGIWGWNRKTVLAVREHHRPPLDGAPLDLASLIYCADAVELEQTGQSTPDGALLADVGLADRLRAWRSLRDRHDQLLEAA